MYNFLASHRDKFLSGLLSGNQEKKKRESIFLQLQKFSGGGGGGKEEVFPYSRAI